MVVAGLSAAKAVQATLDEAGLAADMRHDLDLARSQRLPETRRETRCEDVVR